MSGLSPSEPLQLVSYRSQELFAILNVSLGLLSFWRDAIDDAEDPEALLCLGDDHLHAIGTGTDDVAGLGDGLDCGEDVDRSASHPFVSHQSSKFSPRSGQHCQHIQG